MKTETIENIFNFLNTKEGKEIPQTVLDFIAKEKFIQELENHPDDVQYRYEGDLSLSGRNITKLPNDLYVTGDLDLVHCKQLTKLPDKLHVEGNLILENCNQLTKLPDNLYVKESLALDGANITELPNNLYVGWNLYIYNTSLAKKYTDDEIREMITSKGGTIKARIIR